MAIGESSVTGAAGHAGPPDQPGEARHIAADADEREAREDLFDRRESPQ